MPQLQVKVPTLRRWASKLAVAVDRPFFEDLRVFGEILLTPEQIAQQPEYQLFDLKFAAGNDVVRRIQSVDELAQPNKKAFVAKIAQAGA